MSGQKQKTERNIDILLILNTVKGQLISKGLYGILKNERKHSTYYYDTSGRLVFVRFLDEFEDTKNISKLSDL